MTYATVLKDSKSLKIHKDEVLLGPPMSTTGGPYLPHLSGLQLSVFCDDTQF